VDFSVKLARLPAEVSISDRLGERFRYDTQRRELIYRGFMTKCAYDEISALSDNLDYHRAVEQLFVLTSSEVVPPKRCVTPTFLAATAAAAVVVAALIWGTLRQSSAEPATTPPVNATASTSP
jgi:hypothetical protein